MRAFSITPQEMVASLLRNRGLVKALIQREVLGRYQGSVLGILWSFFNPVFMLAVYTFVFSVVFKARWGIGESESKAEFALILFSGLLLFNLFAECVTRAPSLLLSNTSYVKRVVFPLEILPWVSFGAALFHACINFVVWLLFYLYIFGMPKVTLALFPLILVPFTLQLVGLGWFLSSLGVYLRDVSQMVGILVSTLMFLTPIFYPASALPVAYQHLLYLNPLTFIVELARDLLIFGKWPDWSAFGLVTACSAVVAWGGFAWFQKTRKGFADVL